MKCIRKNCEKEAEYIYLGKSLCEEHFEKCRESVKERIEMIPRKLFPTDNGEEENE